MENFDVREIEKKKRSLRRYKRNLACIDRLERKLGLLNSRILSIKSSNLSGMPRGGTPVTLDDLLSDKEDIEDRIKRLKKKSKSLKRSILEEIDDLEDPRYCEILEAYFIECKRMEDIAEDMGYTERHIYELYKDALTALTFMETS